MSWTPSSLSSLGLFWQPLFPLETKSVSICIKCCITFPLWVGWESPGASKRGWIWDDFVGRKPVKPLVCPRPIRNRGLIPFQSLPQRYFLRRSWVEQKSCPERISWNGRKQQIIQCITHVSLWQELNSKETLVENASKHECFFFVEMEMFPISFQPPLQFGVKIENLYSIAYSSHEGSSSRKSGPHVCQAYLPLISLSSPFVRKGFEC